MTLKGELKYDFKFHSLLFSSFSCLQGFSNHVKNDHNMWNYVYYSLYLDNIDTGDHNAIQKYVYELVNIILL